MDLLKAMDMVTMLNTVAMDDKMILLLDVMHTTTRKKDVYYNFTTCIAEIHLYIQICQ